MVDAAPAGTKSRVDELFEQADRGLLTTQEFMVQIAEVVGATENDVRAMLYSQYKRNNRLAELLPALRRTYKIGLLTNMNDSLIGQLFTEQERREWFDDIVVSSAVGMVKPYGEIFELTAARLEVLPEECVMIDDLERNVRGAEDVGMKGIVYTSVDQCVKELRTMGIDA